MSVSNEDRASAAATVNAALLAAYQSTDGQLAVDALIARGWGPRPTVTRDAIVDHVARLEVPQAPVVDGVLKVSAESMADALIPFLRECGIEVTE